MQPHVLFLGFIVSKHGISADPENVRVIREWHEPKSITETRSFHGLASFYRRFIRGFCTIMALITECLKNKEFKWSNAASQTFREIKVKMIEALVLRYPDFNKVFEVACDASCDAPNLAPVVKRGCHLFIIYFFIFIFYYKLINFKLVHSYNVKRLTCNIFCSSGLQNIYKLHTWKCSTSTIFTLLTK